ncbi:MAG TPA: hypothetical protein VMF51_18080 [Nocardioides sp.]|uniref:hypothetical protein n=1 Tax=Nocardioides sp. TaxID=35761 RepID=UPI002BA1146D|nr:hypothetical protein [Nocardioides sp.]HTW17044.1 hypothetical protein [Nocardioides sp.]
MKIISDPFREHGQPGPVVVDTDGGAALQHVQAAGVEGRGSGPLLAVELEGPLLHQDGRLDVIYLVDADGAAQLCAHVMNTLVRFDAGMALTFHARLHELLEAAK